jgi:branched-chain amino acid transport system substrate-binding protein
MSISAVIALPSWLPIRWHCRALDEGREGLVLSYVSASVGGVMQHIGTDKRIGIISATIGRNLNDPHWQNTAEYKEWLAWMKKYNRLRCYRLRSGPGRGRRAQGSGDNLTRENVMKQATSIHDLKLYALLRG